MTSWIRRVRRGRGFEYCAGRRRVRDFLTLRRIRSLALPPAWKRVKIAAGANQRIQATGRDRRGRRQYHYHRAFRARRNAEKFDRMADFGHALPRIRRRVERDLRGQALARDRVLATVVRILDRTGARIGNDKYARANHTYGISTLQDRHARFGPHRTVLRFRGKNGKDIELAIEDPRVATTVRRCRDQPGSHLFQYEAGNGPRKVQARDVNDYVRRITGADFTTKDFRTWNASVALFELLRRAPSAASKRARKRQEMAALREVAGMLGNTPAVCRKNYIHPKVLMARQAAVARQPTTPRGLTAAERRFLALVTTRNPQADFGSRRHRTRTTGRRHGGRTN